VAPAHVASTPSVVPSQQQDRQQQQVQIQLQESRFPSEEEEESEDEDDAGDWFEYDTDGEADAETEERESRVYAVPKIALQPPPNFGRAREDLINRNGKRAVRAEEEEEEEEETETDGVDSVHSFDGVHVTARGHMNRGQDAQLAIPRTPPRANLRMLPGTPPKRARLIGEYSPVTVDAVQPRLVKRRSEDAEESSPQKRVRVPMVDDAGRRW